MKKILTIILAGTAVFGAVSNAYADEGVQKEEFSISPTVLSRSEPQNIEFVNTITTSNRGTGTFPEQPPNASRVVIDLPKQFTINNTTFPYCDTNEAGIANTTTEQAKAACGPASVVSDDVGSEATIIVDQPGPGTSLTLPYQLTVFNEEGGKLLIHARASSLNNTTILVGTIEDSTAGSAYGKAFDITVPPLVAGAASLFKLTFPQNGYIQATCNPTTLSAQATTYFDDPPTSTDDHSVECTAIPDTTINAGPTGLTNNSDPSFAFSSSDPDATFECRLDGPGAATGTFASCASAKSYTDLADGSYTFQVRSTSQGSYTDPTPASRSFTVDATAPNTTIESGPTGTTNTNDPSFTFSSEAGATFECRLDGPGAATGTFASCASAKSYTDLADGSYTFQVRATDSASNTDPTPTSRSFTIDATPPDTTIDSGPSGTTGDNTPTFTFSSTESGSSFECKIDAGPFGPCSGPGASHTTFGLATGPHEFQVRATDLASNADSTPATRSFTVDTSPPDTVIDSGPTGITGDDASFGFSSDAGNAFECRLDGPGALAGSFSPCTSPKDFTNLADGTYTFQVRAKDAASNTDPTPATRSFTVDASAPNTTIESGPTGTTNNNAPAFSFSSSEANSTFECRLDGPGAATGSFGSCTSPKDFTNLADGTYTFQVRAKDAASNTDPTPATRSFTVDTVVSIAKITKKPKAKIKTKKNSVKVKVSFNSEPGATFKCKLDKASYKPCTSPYSVKAKSKGGNGKKHTISIKLTDQAGNVGRAVTIEFRVIRKG